MIRLVSGEQSIDKHVQLIELLDISLNIGKLLLIGLFSAFGAGGVNQLDMRHLLVLPIDLVPLPLQPFPDLPHLRLAQALSELVHKYFC